MIISIQNNTSMKKKYIYILILFLSIVIRGQSQIILTNPPQIIDLGTVEKDIYSDYELRYITGSPGSLEFTFKLATTTNVFFRIDKVGYLGGASISTLSGTPATYVRGAGDPNYIGGSTEPNYKECEYTCYPNSTYKYLVYGMSAEQIAKIKIRGGQYIGSDTNTENSPMNYILTLIPQKEVSSINYSNGTVSNYLDNNDILMNIQYFDGLGRPVQTVQRGITPDAKDLVSIQEYDAFGRESNTWLPGKVTAANNGAFVALETAKGYIKASNGSDQKPYSLPVYENSPLNRVLKQFGPGQDWHNADNGNGKAVQTAYKTNITGNDTLNCKIYIAGGTNQAPTLTQNGNYATGQLYVTEVKDEDGNTGYEFKDKLGQVVLTRQIENNVNHDTYYVYNVFGNQCFVLPPKIQEEAITQAKLDLLAYQYKYDHRNRCIGKKIPGCEWNYYVYDKADRLIFSQDGEQYNKSPKEWTFTIPDAFGRVVLTGTCTNSLDYSANPLGNIVVKATYNTGRTNPANSYTVTGVTLSAATILSVNFYDGYEFLGITGVPNTADTQYTTEAGYGVCYGDHQAANRYKNKGLLTGTLTAQMNPDGTVSTTYLYSVMYYDNRARLIQTKSNNHLTGGIEKEYIAYNFTGQPTQRKHVHQATGKTTQTEVYAYTYDHAGRLYDTKHKLNSQPETCLLQNRYDEQGRLARQGIGQQAAAPKSQSAPAGGIMKMSAAAPMAMMPSPDIPVPDDPGTPAKLLEYMGSLGANGTLTYSTFLYANRISTPDLQFTLRQSGWVTIEYPLLPALGLTVTTFLTYSNGVCHDMAFANEEDLSTSSVSKIRYYMGAGTYIFNIYDPVGTGVKGVPATITLTASGSTDEGGNNNPEPLDPVNFTVTPAQVVEYTYNVRSWTKSINSPLFVENLDYTYNGNIKWMDWKQDSQTRKYTYTYDNLSRLKTAAYTGIGSEQYGTSYSYDKHGNIKTLQRYGKKDAGNGSTSFGLVDNLTMDHIGNQLTKVTDTVPNFVYIESADFKNYGGSNAIYTYNLNGAMATDSHKGILGIKYNSLNLPYELLIKNTEVSGKVYYTYSASGVKLKTKHMKAQNLGYTPVTGTAGDTNLDVAKTTDYVGNKVYEDGMLKRVLVDGGYIEGGVYHYYLNDHLGNNRMTVNQNGVKTQWNHYYPFGMAFADKYDNGTNQPYKYNGKELDPMYGLNLYDYSARYMDAAIGRFTTVDPLAEKYYSISPYAYCANNPINAIDIGGKFFIFVNGFNPVEWLYNTDRVTDNFYGGDLYIPTIGQTTYPPDRGFNRTDKLNYWKGSGLVEAYNEVYNDKENYFVNASYTPGSTAILRYSDGLKAGIDLLKKLASGEISMADGETIKIVGHSQGAAYAAGIAYVLANSGYGHLLEFIDYLSPHQPGNFIHPAGVKGTQFSTKSDMVSSTGPLDSYYTKIPNAKWGIQREEYNGGIGGHSSDTWLNELINYWRSLGITVNVE
ncbi:hypothetical protein FACS1894179_03270 [Bacteroidia bacterium]|nr:hypothetical protein FACS1894179_03270 [Bacteroidia bacterium]